MQDSVKVGARTMVGALQIPGSCHAPLGQRCRPVRTPVQHRNRPLAYMAAQPIFTLGPAASQPLKYVPQRNMGASFPPSLLHRKFTEHLS